MIRRHEPTSLCSSVLQLKNNKMTLFAQKTCRLKKMGTLLSLQYHKIDSTVTWTESSKDKGATTNKSNTVYH